MNTIYAVSPQLASLEIDRRLREADDRRRRRLVRHGARSTGRSPSRSHRAWEDQ